MNLFELKGDLLAMEEAMEAHALENEGDVSGFDFDMVDDAQEAIDKKLLDCGAWAKNLVAESNAFKAEMAVMAKKKKSIDNKVAWVKGYIAEYFTLDRKKLEDTRVKLSYRKSSAVEIPADLDPEKLSFMYPDFAKNSWSFDKTAIKKALKDGPMTVEMDDTDFELTIRNNQNLQVK